MDNNIEEDYVGIDTGVEESIEEPIKKISIPFDPKLILFAPQAQSIQWLLEKVEYGELELNPDWQRMANIWKFDKKCRLIESLFLRIPIPAFYMYIQDEIDQERNLLKEKWSVIDGLQRLSILNHFIYGLENNSLEEENLNNLIKRKEVVVKDSKNYLVIRKLDYIKLESLANKKKVPETRTVIDPQTKEKDYEYLLYEELDSSYQRILKGSQVTIFTIRLKAEPKEAKQQEQVIYNIFERINTGGLPLSPQEIRNAIKQGLSTRLIKELAESNEFKEATYRRIKPYRMEDRELALRFLYFKIEGFENRELSLKDFNYLLMSVMDKINQFTQKEYDYYKELFLLSMKRANLLFGEFAFTKLRENKKKEYVPYKINKALFETISVNLSLLNDSGFDKLIKYKEEVIKKYIHLLTSKEPEGEDIDKIVFNDSISKSTTDIRHIKKRFQAIDNLFKEFI